MNAGSLASIGNVRSAVPVARRARKSLPDEVAARRIGGAAHRAARRRPLLHRTAPPTFSASSTIGISGTSLALAVGDVGGEHDSRSAGRDAVAERSAPKPANTTEWIAPMRTVASISTIGSGQVGM